MSHIVQLPDPILTTPAREVTSFDKKLKKMVADMEKVLLSSTNPSGVGLAGPQAGYPYRLFLTKPTSKDAIRVFINPKILTLSKETTDRVPERENPPAGGAGKLEGCLSIPNVWGKVKRSLSLTLRYQDETGATHEEKFSGFLATIIQHEVDHLNGTLFTHRVLEQKGKFYQTIKDDNGKEILEELQLT